MSGFVDDLNDAIRGNPVAAGLIGVGVLWMVTRRQVPAVSRTIAGAVGVAADAAEHTAEVLGDAVESSAEAGIEYAGALQRSLADTFERQPLMLGAAGLMIGAAIASAFPITDVENELMGETAESVRERVQNLATQAGDLTTQRLVQAVEDVQEKASAQGMVTGAGREALDSVAEKAKDLVQTAGDAVKRRIS